MADRPPDRNARMAHARTLAERAAQRGESMLDSIWPFLAIVVVLVALALTDFLLVEPAPAARLTLLALRLVAGTALLVLAGLTLRRLFAQRAQLSQALRASEERLVSSLSDIQKRKQAESLLFEEKERAQVTLASIADAVVTVDTSDRKSVV